MNAEALQWCEYARENLEVARLSLERNLFNASLQNAQQAVEKSLKALLLTAGRDIPRTHNIRELMRLAREADVSIELSVDECDLLDAIYIPSKYPVFGVLPGGVADRETCHRCLGIAERVVGNLSSI
jgi:HEPN domain-containing protein